MTKPCIKADLRARPYRLDDAAVAWVEETLAAMGTEERIRQVFAPLAPSTNEQYLQEWVTKYQPGAVMFRPAPKAELKQAAAVLQQNSAVPLLVAGNLEDGGNGFAEDGTYYGKPLQVAATGDPAFARELGRIAGLEAAAAGANWAFAPIVDLDLNWRNPITNVRTFGSDTDTVIAMSRAYKQGFEQSGGVVSVKHFPGDGTDERDQHLHVTFNSLPVAEWMESYGRIYRSLIEDGAHTVMAGHIAFPAYLINKGAQEKAATPATLSPELLQHLLRGELGFNGMIVTDATPMIGFAASAPREEAIPAALAAGCDMILFNRDYTEDLAFMRRGVEQGVVTAERLEDAVRRILGVKAAAGLHLQQGKDSGIPLEAIGSAGHAHSARTMADHAVTLVRDRDALLPLTPDKYRRIFLMPLGTDAGDRCIRQFAGLLEAGGFQVEVQDLKEYRFDKVSQPLQSMKDRYDLAIYAAVERTSSNRTQVRLNYSPMVAINAPWFAQEVPSLAVSFANPYHLLDMPFISTYINAYADSEATVHAVAAQLTGQAPFKGKHPVDAYCGNRWDLHIYD
ncbi:glycoside hydrolase family 3 N-terminal domain-containing protein [Paenibacillus sp. MMS20-IR301]|uniref:glycoside hydrolase family 3 protein n=1 Tax=Paenibacillus sp. MMS20-IR301 TaxID=2895946 RepID=UPI0028E530EF|nr:glycoside hydrolase family 3 N-terminal domain-containing protein [Paenibacillus sp. MMS20-IR301]WNS43154.1 glycoside hydrolase family 3 N-terminal domain-containing protein [Paenibacillus sp. MMS20-IR301]